MEKPNIYAYDLPNTYLKDWLSYVQLKNPRFSLRAMAKRSGLSAAHLSLILNGQRKLSVEKAALLIDQICEEPPEKRYFKILLRLSLSGLEKEDLEFFKEHKRPEIAADNVTHPLNSSSFPTSGAK